MKPNVIEIDREDGQAPSQDRKANLAQSLRHRILSMELAPGASLDEVALAEEFGLSRQPVREFLRQMAAERYLELETNRAARVASMSFDSLRNYFLVASLIYVVTSKLAVAHATGADIVQLRRIQERFRAAVEGNIVDDRVLENDHFHFAIGKMARNPYLMPSLCRLLIDPHGSDARSISRATNPWTSNWRKRCSNTKTSSMRSSAGTRKQLVRSCLRTSISRVATWRRMSRRKASPRRSSFRF